MKPQSNEGLIARIITWWRGLGSRAADAGGTRANRPLSTDAQGQTGSLTDTARQKADEATATASDAAGSVQDRVQRVTAEIDQRVSGLARPLEEDRPSTDTVADAEGQTGSLTDTARQKADEATATASDAAGSVQDRVQRATAEIDQQVSGLARPLEEDSAATDTVADASGEGTSVSSGQTDDSTSTLPDTDTSTSANVHDASASLAGVASAAADVQSDNYGLGNLRVTEDETPEAGSASSAEDDVSGSAGNAMETAFDIGDDLSGQAGTAFGAVSDSASGIGNDLSGQAGTAFGAVSDSASGISDDLSGQAELPDTNAPADNGEETTSLGFGDAAASDTETAVKPLDALGLFGEPGSGSVTDLSYLDDQDSAWFSFDVEGESSATDATVFSSGAGALASTESAEGTGTSAAETGSGFSDPSDVFSDASSAEALSSTSGAEAGTTAVSDVLSDASTTFDASAGEADAPSDQGHDSAGGWVTSWSDEPDAATLSSMESAGSARNATADADADVSSLFDAPAETAAAADTGEATGEGGLAASSGSSGTSSSSTGASNEAGPHAGQVRGNADGSCPVDFPIKGNGSSMIYHAPGRASYDATIAEWCFATEAEAEAAGFRAPKR